jgi:L-malate glycosyltransferase
MTFKMYAAKRRIENVLIFPFIFLGKLTALVKPLSQEFEIIFFFPFYHTGGAEKVHLQITQSIGNKNCRIYFTRKSKENTFLNDFIAMGCSIKDISKYTDNKLIFFVNLFYRGFISGLINKQVKKPIVFNGQSNFGYKVSSWINKDVAQLELIHALNTFSYIRIPFIKNYTTSITVSKEIVEKHFKTYEKIGAPKSFFSKFIFIETRISLPRKIVNKDYYSSPLNVLYVGRGTEEKRVQIVAHIAELSSRENLNIEFHFAGDVTNSIPPELRSACIFHGNVTKEEDLNHLYENSHILIVTSTTESGPLVTMEAMARGLAIITTDVGFVSAYLENSINGFKVPPAMPDGQIISIMYTQIEALYNNRSKLAEIGRKNIDAAYKNFGIESFENAYKKLIDKYK